MPKHTLEDVDARLMRWYRRLNRAANAIKKLEKIRRKLLAKPAPFFDSWPPPKPVSDVTDIPVTELPIPDSLEIPTFLRRNKPLDQAAQVIQDQLDDLKRRKAAGRIAKLKAKKSGETRKMPLTGKAALAAIRGEA